MKVEERFLQYVAFDTQSDPQSETFPSTARQLALLNHLFEEMVGLGLAEVDIDPNGYVTGSIPATPGYDSVPVIGLLAHVDTSPDMKGSGIRPQRIEDYDGGDIRLNDTLMMRVVDFPELRFFKGHTLITTDGTTLLGADDKAGVAEIMWVAEFLMTHPEIKHGKIRMGFTPDEEIGRGVDFFDVARFGAQFAYTLDGGFEGELEYENFNAAGATLSVRGQNIHPGYAKGKMINAIQVLCEVNALLPVQQRPEYTEGYEGFYHLDKIHGTVEQASMEYIIRNHSRKKFEAQKKYLKDVVDLLTTQYGEGVISLVMQDQYYNMREQVEPYPEVVEKAQEAMRRAGVVPVIRPIRGGTDGARLSYMGLPCPNLFTGGMNGHSRFEYCSVTTMERACQSVIHLIQLWAMPKP